MNDQNSVAVLVPCYNESVAIASVIDSFKQHLPTAKIYVYDNNSTDCTVEVAEQAGAIVRKEPQQGKGHVVRRMFSDIEALINLSIFMWLVIQYEYLHGHPVVPLAIATAVSMAFNFLVSHCVIFQRSGD